MLPGANLQNTRDVSGPINSSNVSKLGVAWTVPIKAAGVFGGYATTPVVVGGVVYILAYYAATVYLGAGRMLSVRVEARIGRGSPNPAHR